MTRDVRLRVRRCEIFQASKHGRPTETAERRHPHVDHPWQIVAVNLMGPIPASTRGNNWILVLTDNFTWWADKLANPDALAPTVTRALDQQVFCYFALPEQIHSNQGTQFQSQLMSDLCKMTGVNQSQTTLYHPQGNGVVELNNRMLGDFLKSLLIGKSQGSGTLHCHKLCELTLVPLTLANWRPLTFSYLGEKHGLLNT